MVQAININNNPEVSASYFFFSDFNNLDEIVKSADLLVVCRSRYCDQLNRLITKFKACGKRVLFDIDDFVFDSSYTHLIVNTLNVDLSTPGIWDYWFAYIGRMGEALRLCDGAIVTNEALAERVESYCGLQAKIVPNFMNKEQLAISERLFELKKGSNFKGDGKITLGYFSGSPSHTLDFEIALSGLVEVLRVDERVELLLAGYIDLVSALQGYKNRVRYLPFVDYVNLQANIASVDLNLMPLQTNAFTHCKSELKYFEAAAVGTPSVASPVGRYKSVIQDGVNGYHAKAHEWAEVLVRLITEYDDMKTVSLNAHTNALSEYGYSNKSAQIRNALGW